MDDMLIVDIDAHIHEVPEQMAEYCEMPWKKSLLTVQDIMNRSPERNYGIPGLSPGGGGGSYDPQFPVGHKARTIKSVSQMRSELDGLCIDLAILFPDHLLGLAMFPKAEYAMALARSYNRWLIHEWLGKEKGLYGALCIAHQDPKASAEEIKDLGRDKNIVCIFLPTAGVFPLYGSRLYDPIYEIAEKMNLPVVLHSAGVVHPVFPFQLQHFETVMARHTIAHPVAMAANIIDMITTGVTVRFPNLRVCITEGGISWVPWVMMRLDKEYVTMSHEVPFLKSRPSHHIKKTFGFGTQPIEEPEYAKDYGKLIELLDVDNKIFFASDWPHYDFDHPRKLLSYPLKDSIKEKIMGKNAIQFFNLHGF